ncbi:hypothetical protein EDC94DRAFT_527933, partial [Helicostylum pulchrum]
LPLATLLDLPLYKALIPPDNNHWTLKHKTFLCGQFFIFDVNRNRLRLRVAGEYARYPRLCQQLYNDILITRTVRLQSSIWPYILEERPSIVEWSGHSMVTNITSSSVWKQYSSQNVREGIQSSSPLLVKHPAFVVKTFWTCLMYPNARTLYFRSLSNCLPTKKVLLKYGVVLSSTCSLCGVHTDTTRHFLVECDIKWKLWKLDLQHYFPIIGISSDTLYKSIRKLRLPPNYRDAKYYFSVISTTLYQLWILYWQHGNDNISTYPLIQLKPFSLRIITHIERLLQSTTD